MKLSAPIYILKQKARDLKRSQSISHSEALNRIARDEGYSSWSLLQAKAGNFSPKSEKDILEFLNPGDLLLIAARPGQGKTKLALQLLLQMVKTKTQSFLFTFEYTQRDLATIFSTLDQDYKKSERFLTLDVSDEICANYIIKTTKNRVQTGSLIVIDYLQLLDQQRHTPPLQRQIEDLQRYARDSKCTIICVSQIDRTFDQTHSVRPGLADVRLPNPLDLSLFNKALFLQDEQIYV